MKIGKIISVNYNQFKVKLLSDIRGNSVSINGQIYYFGNIGGYLKTFNSLGEQLICEVVSIFDNDSGSESYNIETNRELLLRPIGTINHENKFTLGVGIFPSIYSEVVIVTFYDMELILKNINNINNSNTSEEIHENINNSNTSKEIHEMFYLGESKNLINYPIHINITSFFDIHSAVLGNSGSGKSNTIAHIIQQIYNKKNYSAIGSKIILFDVNGEYKKAFNNNKQDAIKIRYCKPNANEADKEDGYEPFYLPHFMLSLDEWCAFLMASDATQKPFWSRVLQESYKFYMITQQSEAKQQQFADYFRYKICNLLNILLGRSDSDTALITMARSVIYGLVNVIEKDQKLNESCRKHGLYDDLWELYGSCGLNYGTNNDELRKEVDNISKKINQKSVDEIIKIKQPENSYFGYQFLMLAVDLILLEEDVHGNRRIREYTSTMITRLQYFLENENCNFMRESPNNIKSIEDYYNSLWNPNRSETNTNMIIIDTSELSNDVLDILTSVVTRIIFTQKKKFSSPRNEKPIHIILDEAHRYIKKDTKYLLKENIFEQIAREGRKYATYLIISSQRPSELSETVLSQCSNFIIHRIQNEIDMRYVSAVLPYFSDDFANKIKQSLPGEALVFGNCVPMPLHIHIQKPDPDPSSNNCPISHEWFKDPKTIDA